MLLLYTLLKGASLNKKRGRQCDRVGGLLGLYKVPLIKHAPQHSSGNLYSPLTLMALSKTATSSLGLKFFAAVTVPSFPRSWQTKHHLIYFRKCLTCSWMHFPNSLHAKGPLWNALQSLPDLTCTKYKKATDSFQWKHARYASVVCVTASVTNSALAMPEHTHVGLKSNITGASHSTGWNHTEKKSCATFSTSPQRLGKAEASFNVLFLEFRKGGAPVPVSITHNVTMVRTSFLLGLIFMVLAPFPWNIRYLLFYLSALLHFLFLPWLYLYASLSLFPFAHYSARSSLRLAPKLCLIKLFHSNIPQEEEKKGGEKRVVCLSNGNTATELRTESSGMPK